MFYPIPISSIVSSTGKKQNIVSCALWMIIIVLCVCVCLWPSEKYVPIFYTIH